MNNIIQRLCVTAALSGTVLAMPLAGVGVVGWVVKRSPNRVL